MGEDALVRRAADYLRRRLPTAPRRAVVLGSGLGDLDFGRVGTDVPYSRIPGFPAVQVAGHPGRLSLVGTTAILRGRVHFYEGHSLDDIVRPVRVLARLGVRTLVLTNAAGAVHPKLRPGDLMAIADHLNLMGINPLRGGPHFVDLSSVYEVPKGLGLKSGVYAAMAGPSYETPAEVRMLRKLGADAVGMSTVPEAIVARQEGMRVIGISLITNLAAGVGKGGVSHADVIRTAGRAREKLGRVLRKILARDLPEPAHPVRP
ncbi:MAG TPA: purine-nucleoside phosphorylase [Planctomycetota bacterium]|nr:purine-nucleoside phosphorylase [Planctomycetota bacterium]